VKDDAPDAWAKLIDELLKSPHYGERWGRHWLDVARYADSGGYETDIYFRNAWRYRDYVVKSFNDDKPYDRFVQEQVAGDELWPDNLDLDPKRVYIVSEEKRKHLEARIGTGLYALGPLVHESGLDAGKLRYEQLTDWVDTTGSVFMGLTFGCARCHDHKFDPITQRDYYGMQAIFAGSVEVEQPLLTAMEIADWRQHYPRVIAVDEARAAYRLFEKRVAGRALTPDEESEKRRLLENIAQAVLQLPERAASVPNSPFDSLMGIPIVSVLGHERPELVKSVHLLDRGELSRARAAVEPALPAVLARATPSPQPLSPAAGERGRGEGSSSRKQLAIWLTSAQHPLTARVMVNRLWQWHFGRGIVATPNDFGTMGQPPSHPELLDWLAAEFVKRGWSVKEMHRQIMMSSVYQQSTLECGDLSPLSDGGKSSVHPTTSARAAELHPASQSGDKSPHSKVDPDNHYLWRQNRRRLEAEALWDSVHAAAGTLNPALGGRPVVPPLAEDEIAALREKWHWPVSADPRDHTRRGMYVLVRRNFRFPMFEVFDAPVTSASCPARDVTTVAPQALWSLNNRSVFRQAQEFAGRVVREAGDKPDDWVNRAWLIALARPPSAEEKQESLKLMETLAASGGAGEVGEHSERAVALAKLCLALFNLNEFAFVD